MQSKIDGRVLVEQQLVSSHFEGLALEWPEIYQRPAFDEFLLKERLRVVIDLAGKVGLSSETCVLDIGCGAGFGTLALAKLGPSSMP